MCRISNTLFTVNFKLLEISIEGATYQEVA